MDRSRGITAAVLGVLVCAGGVAVVAHGATAAPNHREPVSAPPSAPPGQYSAALITEQDALASVADSIQGHAKEAGFGGISIDAAAGTVSLAWKGALPADVRSIIDHRPASVAVHVISAKYSLAEIRRFQWTTYRQSAALHRILPVTLTTVYAGTTGDGITLGYDVDPAAHDPGPAAVVAAMRRISNAPIVGAEVVSHLEGFGLAAARPPTAKPSAGAHR